MTRVERVELEALAMHTYGPRTDAHGTDPYRRERDLIQFLEKLSAEQHVKAWVRAHGVWS